LRSFCRGNGRPIPHHSDKTETQEAVKHQCLSDPWFCCLKEVKGDLRYDTVIQKKERGKSKDYFVDVDKAS